MGGDWGALRGLSLTGVAAVGIGGRGPGWVRALFGLGGAWGWGGSGSIRAGGRARGASRAREGARARRAAAGSLRRLLGRLRPQEDRLPGGGGPAPAVQEALAWGAFLCVQSPGLGRSWWSRAGLAVQGPCRGGLVRWGSPPTPAPSWCEVLGGPVGRGVGCALDGGGWRGRVKEVLGLRTVGRGVAQRGCWFELVVQTHG